MCLYLTLGLFLHFSILKVVLVTEKMAFKESSFFQIFVFDSVFSILIIMTDLFFNRLFIYVTPLCPLVSPFFFDSTVILKTVFVMGNYSRFGKSVAQVVMVLNRMSCVLQPTSYKNAWKSLTPICYAVLTILPIGGIWNIAISKVYADPTRGGFTINYIKAVKWAALSMFQSIYILTALVITIICTSITLYKLIVLPNRIKAAEKSLCFTSIFISAAFLLVAASQVRYQPTIVVSITHKFQFPFFICSSCDVDLLLLLQAFPFDSFTVGTAVILILANRHIRQSIFGIRMQREERVRTMSGQMNSL
ncbi:hypothetical protein CRE_06689 [Caenorhabditis remanei]|uniref:Serpentine receptor class gamma n=1 Tax=Caenorhabditis remanei TaxID=31234 RepID=E3M0Z5_CAERE|nr:hypothetical protein CRE_06689 [Caenorhabditis remanei]